MDFDQTINRRGAVLERRDDGVTDAVTDDGIIYRTQDVTRILEANKAARAADKFKGFRLAPTFRKVASIPVTVIDIAAKQGYDLTGDPDAMRRFLNDPQNVAFRTTLERV